MRCILVVLVMVGCAQGSEQPVYMLDGMYCVAQEDGTWQCSPEEPPTIVKVELDPTAGATGNTDDSKQMANSKSEKSKNNDEPMESEVEFDPPQDGELTAVITADYKPYGTGGESLTELYDGDVLPKGGGYFKFSAGESVFPGTDPSAYYWHIYYPAGETDIIHEEGDFAQTFFTRWYTECGQYEVVLDIADQIIWSSESAIMKFIIACE